MSTQQEDSDLEDTIGANSEPVSYAKILHDNQYIYGAYGFFDALNLVLTVVPKLGFDESYSSAAEAAEALHEWMASPLGIAIMVIESAILIPFSALSYLFDDDDENLFKRYIAITWPYIRDMLKALKWAYKGVRNAFFALLELCGTDARTLIVPFAIVLGAMSVLNRWWQRWMKNERKAMMKANTNLLEEIAAKGNKLHVLSELSADKNTYQIYANSYVFVKSKSKSDNSIERKLVYIHSNGEIENINVKNILAFDKDLNKVLLENLVYVMQKKLKTELPIYFSSVLPQAPYSEEYFNSYVFVNDAKATNKLFLIDNEGVLKPVEQSIQDKFEKDFIDVRHNVNLIGPKNEQFETLLVNHGIAFNNYKLGLDFVDWAAERKKIELKLEEKGRQSSLLRSKCYLAAIYAGFIDSLYFYLGAMSLTVFIPPLFIGLAVVSTIFALLFIINKVYEEYDFQRKLEITETRVRVALCVKELDLLITELNNTHGLYAYLDSEKNLESHFNEKLPLPISQKRGEYKKQYFLYGKELAYIDDKSDLFRIKFLSENIPDNENFKDKEVLKSLLQTHQDVLSKRWKELSEEFIKHQKILHSQIAYSYGSAALEGLKYGLAVNGVFSSALFATAALLVILSMPCSPWLVIGCMAISVASLITFIAYALIRHHAYLKTIKTPESINEKKLGSLLEQFQTIKIECLRNQSSSILDAKERIYENIIDPAPYFPLFEWCEILRYFFSGSVKGEKAVGEISGSSLNDSHQSIGTFILLSICAIGNAIVVSVIFSLRALAKGFGRPADDVPEPKPIPLKFFFNKENMAKSGTKDNSETNKMNMNSQLRSTHSHGDITDQAKDQKSANDEKYTQESSLGGNTP